MGGKNEKKKILIIEDDELLYSMYNMKLSAEGFEVFIATTGSEGLSIAVEKQPDFIILDIILPQLDGFAILEKLKEDINTKKIPVTMLTNLNTEEDQLKAKQLGAIGYLVKANLTPSEISTRVKEYFKT
ncbi:response regulator [Patescibacteria group bacterium]|nr:response regulator [Patescibacteria group bacterium]MBU1956489.1 response regulator [Patescibacteria group bacterium]MBU2010287.1 response regulator [Patescibacteria group bacterium]MBU2416576.1 response regulator [Patescibacteria group bacterium]